MTHVVQFLDFTTAGDFAADIAIEQVSVAPNTEAASKTIKELQIGRDLGVIVMAIRSSEGRMSFNPPADTAIKAGDCLIVMGRQESLRTTGSAGGRPSPVTQWGRMASCGQVGNRPCRYDDHPTTSGLATLPTRRRLATTANLPHSAASPRADCSIIRRTNKSTPSNV